MTNSKAYYVSHKAFSQLLLKAKEGGYVKWNSDRARGFSQFLNELAQIEMTDSRPPLVYQRHLEEVAHNRAPTWMNVRMRKCRLLYLTEDSIARYLLVAFDVGIIRGEPYAIGGPDRKTPYPTVSLVIEGLGLGWITPEKFPRNKNLL